MTVRAHLPQRPRHIPILDEDWDWLVKAYGPASEDKIGPGPAIRFIVHKFVKSQKALEQAHIDRASGPGGPSLQETLE